MQSVVQFTGIEATRLLGFCRIIDDFGIIFGLSIVPNHNLLFIIKQNCDDVLSEIIEETVEPLTNHIVFLIFVTCTVGALKIVYVVCDWKVSCVRQKHVENSH